MSKSSISTTCWLSKPIKALLLDITGVLYESGTTFAIKGSVEAIQKLRRSGMPFRLLTNETQKVTSKLIEKLDRLGYDFQEYEVITPAMICRQYLQSHELRPHLLVHPDLEPEFEDIDRHDPNCVVIGDAVNYFTFHSMNTCFKLLMSLKDRSYGSDFIATNSVDNKLISLGNNKYYCENGELKMDLGGFTAALEYATDLKAKIIGKPSQDYFQTAMDSFVERFPKDQVLMIGDDIIGDVKGAQDFGLRGVLVRTGKYMPINESHPLVKPDTIVDNLEYAVDQILQVQQR